MFFPHAPKSNFSFSAIEQGKAVAVDLAFIVDRSEALTSKEIQAQYTFIKYLAVQYFLSLEWSHFGVITAAESANLAIKFGDYYNIAGFEAAMGKLSTLAGGTLRFDLALAAAVNQLFTTSGGMRSDKAR